MNKNHRYNLVQFSDRSWGVLDATLSEQEEFDMFVCLGGVNLTYAQGDEYFEECKGSEEQAREAFEYLTRILEYKVIE